MIRKRNPLIGKDHIASRALQPIAGIMNDGLQHNHTNKYGAHDKTACTAHRTSGKTSKHEKSKKDRHFRKDLLHKSADKRQLNTFFVAAGKPQHARYECKHQSSSSPSRILQSPLSLAARQSF